MIAHIIFRLIKPKLDAWWVDRILAYHEGLVARQQIGPPVGPQMTATTGEIIAFPTAPKD